MEGEFRVNNLPDKVRLDVFLATKSGISRNQIQNLIAEGKVLLNGKEVKKNIKIEEGDLIQITALPTSWVPTSEYQVSKQKIKPQNIPLNIVYEDEDIIVLNKSAGMVVHPTSKIRSGTLVNALLFHRSTLSRIGGEERPGLVHRLDRDTSGIMVVAKNDFAHLFLAKQFKDRKVRKKYIALVYGEVKEEVEIETFFGRHPRSRKKFSTWGGFDRGKKAVTIIKILEKFKDYTLLEVYPKTGRTHQIRVHLAYIGHPVVGDRVYGKNSEFRIQNVEYNVKRQMLHAQSIGFVHPKTDKYIEFSVPISEDMQKVIEKLRR